MYSSEILRVNTKNDTLPRVALTLNRSQRSMLITENKNSHFKKTDIIYRNPSLLSGAETLQNIHAYC